jgi:hypothetical protein
MKPKKSKQNAYYRHKLSIDAKHREKQTPKLIFK